MDQPLYLFGQSVHYSGIHFIVNSVEYRKGKNGRPEGYYYEDPREIWHHEGAVKAFVPPAQPITALEFNGEWQRLNGCTWKNSHEANIYTGLMIFLRKKGLVI